MSQQPKTCRIAGSAEQVVNQLQAQCPNLAHMMVGSLAAMAQAGSRQVTLDFHQKNSGEQVDVTITEDSITIKRGSYEPQQNHKTDKAHPKRNRRKLSLKVADKASKTEHATPDERGKAKGAAGVEGAQGRH